MKVINNFLETEIANKIYANLIKRFDLDTYRSHCFYDSSKDDPGIYKFIFSICPKLKSLAGNDFHMYCNSFLDKSRNIGPHFPSCSFKRHDQLMLCRRPHIGGEIIFPSKDWEVGDPQNNTGTTISLRHNRLISSETKEQRIMNFISLTKHPIIYLNILS